MGNTAKMPKSGTYMQKLLRYLTDQIMKTKKLRKSGRMSNRDNPFSWYSAASIQLCHKQQPKSFRYRKAPCVCQNKGME
jgi:hypothetical protein